MHVLYNYILIYCILLHKKKNTTLCQSGTSGYFESVWHFPPPLSRGKTHLASSSRETFQIRLQAVHHGLLHVVFVIIQQPATVRQ